MPVLAIVDPNLDGHQSMNLIVIESILRQLVLVLKLATTLQEYEGKRQEVNQDRNDNDWRSQENGCHQLYNILASVVLPTVVECDEKAVD